MAPGGGAFIHIKPKTSIFVFVILEAPEWKDGADALTNSYMKSEIEGTELKLSCPAKGRPRPELIWYKDDEAFFPRTDKVRICRNIVH